LDIPQITKLMLAIRKRGVDVDAGIYTVEQAEAALRKLYTK